MQKLQDRGWKKVNSFTQMRLNEKERYSSDTWTNKHGHVDTQSHVVSRDTGSTQWQFTNCMCFIVAWWKLNVTFIGKVYHHNC